MRHQSCCVVNCKNISRKSKCKFYKFPTAEWKINQRNRWIAAVKRLNVDGSPWVPKPYDCICSDHFIGGKKSEEELSPAYVPTIFPSIYKSSKVNESSAINRYKRFMNRQMNKKIPSSSTSSSTSSELNILEPTAVINSQTSICNRYVINDLCHAETQTEIVEGTRPIKIYTGNKKIVDKEYGTHQQTFADKEIQVDNKHFTGFSSMTKDQEIIDLAGFC